MSINIIELLSHHQGIENLPKIDPNTQDVKDKQNNNTDLLLQSVIPAVLAGFYKYSRNDDDAKKIADINEDQSWVDTLFGSEKNVLIDKIANYSSSTPKEVELKIEEIADDAVTLIKDNSGNTGSGIKSLLTNERNNILQHLPGAIGIGEILDDTTLDDRTNKMEGPVSSLMHAIEKKFTSADINEKKNF